MLLGLVLCVCAPLCAPAAPASATVVSVQHQGLEEGRGVPRAGRAGGPAGPAGVADAGDTAAGRESTVRNTCVPASLALLLSASPPGPVEGHPMNLTCEHRPPKSGVAPHFRFLRDSRALGQGWSRSPRLELAAVWSEDSGAYWCEARAAGDTATWGGSATRSRSIQVRVHRVPICNVSLETQPPGGRVMEGEKLVLLCLAAGGTGDITFHWYRGTLGLSLETQTQRSLAAAFEIPTVRERDSDRYYCAANNGHGPSISELVSVTVAIPVSRPVLTLGVPGARAVAGTMLELRCEAGRGSPPILYRFYHEDVSLGSSTAPSGGGASFNLSLTAEHSGNYSCEASNGRRPWRSEAVPLQVTEHRRELAPAVIKGLLLGTLAFTAVALLLLLCCWLTRRTGRRSARDAPRSAPRPGPQESTYLNSAAPGPGQPTYENVTAARADEVYSLATSVQREQQPPPVPPRTYAPAQGSVVVYSGLKRVRSASSDYEDAM